MGRRGGPGVARGAAPGDRFDPRVGSRTGLLLDRQSWVLLLFLLILLGCSPALAGTDAEVRVLLYSGADPIRVGHPHAPESISLSDAGTLSVAGRGSLRHWTPSGGGPWRVGSRVVRGRVHVRSREGRIEVLNQVPLEDYVASTVGGEMIASWPREALRAQAVAARTYVLHEAFKRRDADWDVRATALSQVYRGIEVETRETRAAARATTGEVLTYHGEPILAVFHSTAGGRTATAGEVWGRDLPYLRIVDVDDEDEAPHTYWRTAFSSEDLQLVFETAGVRVGRIEELRVTSRTSSGRVEALAVHGSDRIASLRGSDLRSILGGLSLRSTLFEVRKADSGFAFVGSGNGHGVGMSQWGARAMARRGVAYPKILETFYPGARIEKWRNQSVAARGPGPAPEWD